MRAVEQMTDLGIGELMRAVVFMFVAATAGVLATTLQPVRGEPVAVIVAPSSKLHDAVSVLAAADGELVATGAYPFVLIARSDQPDFARRLRAAGAWLVVDARLARACLSIS